MSAAAESLLHMLTCLAPTTTCSHRTARSGSSQHAHSSPVLTACSLSIGTDRAATTSSLRDSPQLSYSLTLYSTFVLWLASSLVLMPAFSWFAWILWHHVAVRPPSRLEHSIRWWQATQASTLHTIGTHILSCVFHIRSNSLLIYSFIIIVHYFIKTSHWGLLNHQSSFVRCHRVVIVHQSK